jgi:hypothetical protein
MKRLLARHLSMLIVVMLLLSVTASIYDPNDDDLEGAFTSISSLESGTALSDADKDVDVQVELSLCTMPVPFEQFIISQSHLSDVALLIKPSPLLDNLTSRAPPLYS